MSEEWKKTLPQKLVVTFGLFLMALSPFLPWLSASAPILFGLTISRTGLELAPETGMFALVFLVIGLITLWFYKKPRRSRPDFD